MTPEVERMDAIFKTAMALAPAELRVIAMQHALALPDDPTIEETDQNVASMIAHLEDLIRRKRS